MKWLSVTMALMITSACQNQQPATYPPGMPLELEHSDMASNKTPSQAGLETTLPQ